MERHHFGNFWSAFAASSLGGDCVANCPGTVKNIAGPELYNFPVHYIGELGKTGSGQTGMQASDDLSLYNFRRSYRPL